VLHARDAKELYHLISLRLSEIDCEGRPHPKHCSEMGVLAALAEFGYHPTYAVTQGAFRAAQELIQEDGSFSIDEVAIAIIAKLH
jgi:hypothetical protein